MPRGVWKGVIIAEHPGDRQIVKVDLPAAKEVASGVVSCL